MSGFLEFIEIPITCPFCAKIFNALHCEDISITKRKTLKTKFFLASGYTECPGCKKLIVEKDLSAKKTHLNKSH